MRVGAFLIQNDQRGGEARGSPACGEHVRPGVVPGDVEVALGVERLAQVAIGHHDSLGVVKLPGDDLS